MISDPFVLLVGGTQPCPSLESDITGPLVPFACPLACPFVALFPLALAPPDPILIDITASGCYSRVYSASCEVDSAVALRERVYITPIVDVDIHKVSTQSSTGPSNPSEISKLKLWVKVQF